MTLEFTLVNSQTSNFRVLINNFCSLQGTWVDVTALDLVTFRRPMKPGPLWAEDPEMSVWTPRSSRTSRWVELHLTQLWSSNTCNSLAQIVMQKCCTASWTHLLCILPPTLNKLVWKVFLLQKEVASTFCSKFCCASLLHIGSNMCNKWAKLATQQYCVTLVAQSCFLYYLVLAGSRWNRGYLFVYYHPERPNQTNCSILWHGCYRLQLQWR